MKFWEAYASLFFTSTPVIPSNTLIVEQISSSPWPVAMAAWNIWWVKEVKGRGTPRSRPDSSMRPMSLCIHFTEKLVVKSQRKTKGALKAMRPDFAAELSRMSSMRSGSTPALVASTNPSLKAWRRLERMRWAAESEGLVREGLGRWWVEMVGVRWFFAGEE